MYIRTGPSSQDTTVTLSEVTSKATDGKQDQLERTPPDAIPRM